MSNEIQKARDVLAKWRDGVFNTARHPWEVTPYGVEVRVTDQQGYDIAEVGDLAASVAWFPPSVATLIVGTAGNPELLDAIDGLLACGAAWVEYESDHVIANQARHIAAAIIAADERMRS